MNTPRMEEIAHVLICLHAATVCVFVCEIGVMIGVIVVIGGGKRETVGNVAQSQSEQVSAGMKRQGGWPFWLRLDGGRARKW